MESTGIRALKDNLSRYIRRIEAGERIAITAHGRVVAELVPPGTAGNRRGPTHFDELVVAAVIRPPLESGDPTEGWPDIRLSRWTAAELIDSDRGEAQQSCVACCLHSGPAAVSAESAVGIRYIESSALVAALLEHDAEALKSLRARARRITSAVTFAEASRAIVRARVGERLTADAERAAVRALRRFERRCYIVAVIDEVLAPVKRPFPVEPLRTLDAVHIAAVESIGEPPQLVSIVTRDHRVRDNAKALGYSVA